MEPNNSSEDYYALLNLSTTATTAQVKTAFKSISMFHPDKLQSASHRLATREERQHFERHRANYHEEWVKINRAKTVLMDPILRSIYDEFGFDGLSFAETTVLKQTKRRRHGEQTASGSHTTEVGFHTPASIRIMQNVRNALQIRNQNELVARLSTHSSIQMDVNLEHVFDSNEFATLPESWSESFSLFSSLN